MVDSKLCIQDLLTTSSKIAKHMIAADAQALGISLESLRELENATCVLAAVEIRRFTRIGRLTKSDTPSFGFSHRQFHEFFVVASMTPIQVEAALDSIQTDNRFRDILALYCETAPLEHVGHVANHSLDLLQATKGIDSFAYLEKFRGGVQLLRLRTY